MTIQYTNVPLLSHISQECDHFALLTYVEYFFTHATSRCSLFLCLSLDLPLALNKNICNLCVTLKMYFKNISILFYTYLMAQYNWYMYCGMPQSIKRHFEPLHPYIHFHFLFPSIDKERFALEHIIPLNIQSQSNITQVRRLLYI